MAKANPKKLKIFVDEYLISLNGKEAAIKAGYGANRASSQAVRLLKREDVKTMIAERMAEKEKKLIADQDEILKYLTSVIRGQSQSEVVVVEGIEIGVSEARRITKCPDEKEKLKAAELLGKRYDLFNKVNIEGAIPVVISGEDKLED